MNILKNSLWLQCEINQPGKRQEGSESQLEIRLLQHFRGETMVTQTREVAVGKKGKA